MRYLMFIVFVLSPCMSTAATYCVKTGAQLISALNAAAASAADDEIRVASGAFENLPAVSLEIQGGLTLSGGWSTLTFGLSCTKQVLGAKTWMFGSAENAFYLRPRAALHLERLDFVGWSSVAISDSFPEPAPRVLPEIRISRSSFNAMSARGLFLIVKRHHTLIENSLFAGNALEGLKVFGYPDLASGAKLVLQFNTFSDNQVGMFVNGGNPPSLLDVRILNSVFSDQDLYDIEIYGPVAEVKNSLWNTAGLLTLSPDSTANLTGSAGLNSQLRPLPGSQLIDAGSFDPAIRPKFDYVGSSRLQGLFPDIGAFEGAAN